MRMEDAWHPMGVVAFCECTVLPIGSMYAIYGNIYHQYTPNVSIKTIHGSYGLMKVEPTNFEIVFYVFWGTPSLPYQSTVGRSGQLAKTTIVKGSKLSRPQVQLVLAGQILRLEGIDLVVRNHFVAVRKWDLTSVTRHLHESPPED